MKNSKKGFTLIELLIVIALLGALAVGLLAALDPFEQLKKGTDTGIRNTVSEFQGAVIRYYALKNQMPWCADSDCVGVSDGFAGNATGTSPNNLSSLAVTTSNIIATGELKSDFSTLAGGATLAKITVFGSNSLGTIEVCYKPSSKSFTSDPNTKFDPNTGAVATKGTCTTDPTTNPCLWCVK